MTSRPPLPPFTQEAAIQKVRLAEDDWNTRDPEKVSLATQAIHIGGTVPSSQPGESRSSHSSHEVDERDGLPTQKGVVGIPGKPYRSTLRIRIPRRLGELVPRLRK